MELEDKKIIEYELASELAKVVSRWVKKNGVDRPAIFNGSVAMPTCHSDSYGNTHSDPLIVCNVNIVKDYADIDFDDDDF